MSAATAAIGHQAAPSVPPFSAALVPPEPPRKLTGRRLCKALLHDPRFREAVAMHDVVPIGAEAVLAAVCDLVADQVGSWVWRPIAPLRDRTAQVLGIRMGKVGGEAAIDELLGALVTVGLVVREEDGALTVPADFAALTRPQARAGSDPARVGAPGFVDRGGRPRRGENPDQRQLRLLAAVGGKPPSETPEVSGRFPREVFDPPVENPETRFPVVHSNLAAAEVQNQEYPGFQQQQEEATPAWVTEIEVSGETGGFEVSGFGADPAALPEALAVQAQVLAMQVGEILGVDGSRGTPGATLCAEWLGMPGITGNAVLEIARSRKGANDRKVAERTAEPIGTFDFLDGAVRQRAGLPARHQVQAPAPAAAARALPKALERSWLTPQDRYQLGTALELLEARKMDALASCLVRMKRIHPRALGLLVEHRPELREVVDLPAGAG